MSERHRINEQIPNTLVRVLSRSGDALGVMSTIEGLQLARASGLDLVEIEPCARRRSAKSGTMERSLTR